MKDVAAREFVIAFAKHLKRSGRVEVPKWADIVKTASFKELAPYDADWFYTRVASVARKVYLHGGTGVGSIRKIYGGSKRNGVAPKHFGFSSGSVARAVLKQLETLKIVEKDPRGGRRITTTGQRDLDRIAGLILTKKTPVKKAPAQKTTTQKPQKK